MATKHPASVLTAADMLLTAKGVTATMGVGVQLCRGSAGLDTSRIGTIDTASTSYGDGRYIIRLPYGGRFMADIDMYLRGFLDHECGHIRFTDFDRAANFCMNYKEFPSVPYDMVTRLYNIFEDIRIERLMSEMYPGCRTNLRRLNVALFTLDTVKLPETFTAPGDEMVAPIVYDALSVAAVSYTLRRGLELLYNENFHASEYNARLAHRFGDPEPGTYEHGLISYVFTVADRLAEDAARARSMDDVETCVRGMCALLTSLFPQITQSVNPPEGKKPGKGLQENTPGKQQALESKLMQQAANALAVGNENKHAQLIEAMQDRVISQRGRVASAVEVEAKAAIDLASEMELCGKGFIPRSDPRPWRHSLEFTWRSKTPAERLRIEAIASRCRGMFQSLLETMSYRREKVGFFGKGLDTRRLWRSRIGDGRLFRTRAERRMLDTDVCLLADASGSMDKDMDNYMLVLHGISRALRRLSYHIRSSAYLFNGDGVKPFMAWDGDVPAMSVGVKAANTTPMAGALLDAIMSFPNGGPDTRRIVFILTDGLPDSTPSMQMAVETARARGFELYGIGLGTTRIHEYLGEDNTCSVETIDELLPALERMLMLAFARRMAA